MYVVVRARIPLSHIFTRMSIPSLISQENHSNSNTQMHTSTFSNINTRTPRSNTGTSCTNGYFLNNSQCTVKQCYCEGNGVAASGTDCPTHGDGSICMDCDDGYHFVNSFCSSDETSTSTCKTCEELNWSFEVDKIRDRLGQASVDYLQGGRFCSYRTDVSGTWCWSSKCENFNRISISHYHKNIAQITRISL